jgi:general secretion pathway protein J
MRPGWTGAAARRAQGFTLVEVVITLAITALIMLGLVSALATFGQSGSRADARLARIDDVRLVSAFLRSVLARSSSAYTEYRDGAGATALFDGDARQLRWLGVMPARHGAGGLHLFRLFLGKGLDGAAALMLQYLPYSGGGLPEAWESAPSKVLVSGVTGFGFSYRDGAADAVWQTQWRDRKKAPELVQVSIAAGNRDWPELVVRVRATDMLDGGVRIVHGPTR